MKFGCCSCTRAIFDRLQFVECTDKKAGLYWRNLYRTSSSVTIRYRQSASRKLKVGGLRELYSIHQNARYQPEQTLNFRIFGWNKIEPNQSNIARSCAVSFDGLNICNSVIQKFQPAALRRFANRITEEVVPLNDSYYSNNLAIVLVDSIRSTDQRCKGS